MDLSAKEVYIEDAIVGKKRFEYEDEVTKNPFNYMLWIKYADFEMKNKFFNNARNVWDRAVTLLPRVDQLWFKYIHMEEKLGNVALARQIFERWMNWSPDQKSWLLFINFELKYNEIGRARSLYERFVLCHPKETAFISFAEFEARCKEVERARYIYKFALNHIPRGRTENLCRKFLAFEKQYGDKEGIEYATVEKKRFEYEDEVRKNPFNYDSWFDYVRLEESVGNRDRIREVYERAVSHVPTVQEKPYWGRYIYLWINYALYEETETNDLERTRDVYRTCLNLIPHSKFTFAKIWVLAAKFEIRQLNLPGARKILGNAIGRAAKDKIFKTYIDIELGLGNINRCRKLFERYIEWSPENCYAWRSFAEFEVKLQETERARAIYELGVSQPLDMAEVLWKAYIDFEKSERELERTRALYERLLDLAKHWKVWVSFAKFEASGAEHKEYEEEEGAIERTKECIRRARAILERAYKYYTHSKPELKEELSTILEEWIKMERGFGKHGDVKLPKKLK